MVYKFIDKGHLFQGYRSLLLDSTLWLFVWEIFMRIIDL